MAEKGNRSDYLPPIFLAQYQKYYNQAFATKLLDITYAQIKIMKRKFFFVYALCNYSFPQKRSQMMCRDVKSIHIGQTVPHLTTRGEENKKNSEFEDKPPAALGFFLDLLLIREDRPAVNSRDGFRNSLLKLNS